MAGEMNFGILDTSIPSRIANSFAEGQDMRRKNALAELAYGQAMQAQEDDKAYRSAYQQSAGDMNALQRILVERGLYKQGNELKKTVLEMDAKKVSIDKDRAETAAKTYKLGQDQTQDALVLLSGVRDQPSWEQAVSTYKQLYPQANLQTLPAQYSPEVVQGLTRQMIGLKSPDKLMPNVQTRNTGGTTDTLAIDPITGQVTVTNSVQNTQSPDSKASVAVQMRGQNMTDARAREANASGKAPAGYRYKADGTLEAIPGGPADIKAGEIGEKRERQQKASIEQADRIINKVDQALGKVSGTTAGLVGAGLAYIPGTDAKNLASDLETIRANLGFAELQAMRDASPTGGALGAIAVQELTALQSTLASLDQAQGDKQLRERLGEVKQRYQNWKAAVQKSREAVPEQQPISNASGGLSPEEQQELQALRQRYGKGR